MKPMPFAYFRGAVVPIEEATLSLASHSLQYGSTCFTGMRGTVHAGKVRLFRLKEHFKRLRNSIQIMGWSCDLTFERFKNALEELIQKNQPETDFYIRPFLLTEDEELKLDYANLSFDLAIYLVPFGGLFDPNRGLKLLTSSWRKISDEMMPTKAKAGGCYVNSCLAASEARRLGADDALMVDRNGHIVELSGANILLVREGKLVTPPLGSDLLDGITIRSCIEILASEGLVVEEAPIDRSMLSSAEELIATGTAAQISFAAEVDGRKISDEPGLICTLLRKRWNAIMNGQDPQFNHWVSTLILKENCHVKTEEKSLEKGDRRDFPEIKRRRPLARCHATG